MKIRRKAILVTYPDEFVNKEAMGLAEAAGFDVEQTIVRRHLKRGMFGISSGKAEEIKQIAYETSCEDLIIDEGITSSQIYNLANLTGMNVIDREKIILDIFAKRATTTEAKLQVQLAELSYELPRARQSVRLSIKGEKQGISGIGEYAVDVRFRAIRKQMAFVKAKLKDAGKRRNLYRSRRQKLNLPLVSLVGYTSSGKTTLFNRMTHEDRDISENLFTTLTTTTRSMTLEDSTKVLLSDTVGFISRIPTYMIEAFKSTLEDLNYADLLLLVIDASEPLYDLSIKYDTCLNTLSELKIPTSKIITILNKSDITSKEAMNEVKEILENSPYIITSAKQGDGVRILKNNIRKNTGMKSEAIVIK
jgi:GTP-binding protein HflX